MRVAERVAGSLITIGGIGTILAVGLIFVFLVWVVLPLFTGADLGATRSVYAAPAVEEQDVLRVDVDEHGLVAWSMLASGSLRVVSARDGEPIETLNLFDGAVPTAVSFAIDGDSVAFGFEDGSVILGSIGFETIYLRPEEEDASLAALGEGQSARFRRGVAQRTPENQIRLQQVRVELGEPVASGWTSPIRRMDHSTSSSSQVLAALSAEGRLGMFRVRSRTNHLTGEVKVTLRDYALPFEQAPGAALPEHLLIAGGGESVFLAWPDGRTLRYDTRDPKSARVAEELDLVEEPDERITALGFVLGKSTLAVGDSLGRVRCWFGTKPADAETVDGIEFVQAQELLGGTSPVRALAPSRRSRILAAGFEDGSVEVWYATSGNHLASGRTGSGDPIRSLTLHPKQDGLLALDSQGLWGWTFDPGHPEATLAALFLPVWYEGAVEPEHVWESSSGTDDFEPKLGLYPLVFGTIKATLYSMLFGVPIALLAAIYTSEFLDQRTRVAVKSLIEIMAGLPSVVLGFLAALVIAPFVQQVVPATLALFATVPISLLFGAYLWQLLPERWTLRMAGKPKLVVITLVIPCAALVAWVAGPLLERAFFGGDFLLWLDGQQGSAVSGWMFLLWPFCGALLVFVMGRWISPRLRSRTAGWSRSRSAWFDLCRFTIGLLVALALAWLVGAALDTGGLDPRGGVLGTYVQRNALVVGFVMGFAIIPIIYTLAEDALSSVPTHLREASLGAGATPWQTATRVIVPTAASGLFSAAMIGLGRAVGETMIVLMATGNTAVMEWNVFSGFRTLSANIAVELPEAVPNDTHYRILFLAALVLFAMTFVLNTLAEIVRQRFRKRAFQL